MGGLHEAVRESNGPVAVDLHEAEDAYLIVADLPGATEKTTTIDATDERLQIVARRELQLPEAGSIIRQERPERLELELPMPAEAVPDEAEASLAKGVLEIRIPRGPSGTNIPITEE